VDEIQSDLSPFFWLGQKNIRVKVFKENDKEVFIKAS